MFRTTIKGLRAHKVRLLATMLSIVLGVALMAGTLVLTDTVNTTFEGLYADINAGTDAVVRSAGKVGGMGGDDQRAPLPDELVTTVRATDGVAAAEGNVTGYAQFVGSDGKALGDPGMGAPTLGINWPGPGMPNPFNLVDGRAPTGGREVVVDKASADKGGFTVGGPVVVLTQHGAQELTVSGIARFGAVDSPLGASIALFDLPAAQHLVGQPGKVSAITVVATDGTSQEQVTERLQGVLPAEVEAITGAASTVEQQSAIKENLSFFSTFLLTFALIALFVGAFIIANTFSIIVAQRTRELALLRALGAARKQVRRAVLLEALIVGVVASAVGVGAGLLMASGLKALLAAVGMDIPATGMVVTSGTVITTMVVGIVVTVGSALLPSRKAARVAPIAALRDVAIDSSATSQGRLVAGLVVLAAGGATLAAGLTGARDAAQTGIGAFGLLIGVSVLGPVIARPLAAGLGAPIARLRGTSGRLARANAMRNPKRTSATASALMIGVALVGFITIFAASAKASIDSAIDRTVRADLVVDSGMHGFGGLSPDVAARLAEAPEVDRAIGIRMTQAEIRGDGDMIVGVDTAQVERVANLEVVQGSLADVAGGDRIAISSEEAIEKGLRMGDTVPVRFIGGERNLTVAAIYDNGDLAGGQLIDAGLYAQVVPQVFDQSVYIVLADGVSGADGKAAVERVTASHPNARVQDLVAYKAQQAAPIDQMLSLIYALLFLAVLIAVMGIANTLALSVHERTRELGLLRAVGMSRRQLRTSVRWESVIIALFGTALGLGVGLFFGWAMVQALSAEGFDQLRVPANQLVAVTVLAGIAGIIAALLPARRAARLDVLGAIAGD